MSLDTSTLQDWVGRTREVEDVVTPRLLANFDATLGTTQRELPRARPRPGCIGA